MRNFINGVEIEFREIPQGDDVILLDSSVVGSVIDTKDHELSALLEFIAGKGRFKFLGNGIHTYPGGDERAKKVYDACLELEKLGKIYRVEDQPDYVWFKAVE